MSAEKIISDWKKKNFAPLYWLEGEEEFYIDQVVDYAEHHILPESEASFNLSVFYGKDADWSAVVNACMRYPMFAEKQVVLLKEAQQMRDIEKLENYFENPLASTIFVVSYKEKGYDKRTKFYKAVQKNGQVFNSEKVKDYKLQEWITAFISDRGFSAKPKVIALLAEHIGNDLTRISNELEKITVNLSGRNEISEDDIEKYIGVSKEYNVFELQDAICKKNLAKAYKIIQYFEGNPKAGPIQMLLPTLYGYFSKLLVLISGDDKSEAAARRLFFNNFYAARQALETIRVYDYRSVEQTILLLHEYNLKSVGVNDTGTSDASLLKEMVVKIIGY